MSSKLYHPFSLTRLIPDPVKTLIEREFKFPLTLKIPMTKQKVSINDFSELFVYLDKYIREGIDRFNELTKSN